MTKQQTVNKRPNGTFAPGNKLGNRFKPGASGNPHGRPRLTVLSEALRAELAEQMPGASERTVAEALAAALVAAALNGDVAAAREIADRTEGKARQQVDVDMAVMDWRDMARKHGLSAEDVIDEARRLIEESAADSSGA